MKKDKVGILNHAFSNENYGALLVAYAMENLVTEFGYEPITLIFNTKSKKELVFEDFRKNCLHVTKPLKPYQFKRYNKTCNSFIVGSDQVWRNWWNNFDYLKTFFLSFTDFKKKNIAYAASFGIDSFQESSYNKQKVKNYLSSFSRISVREFSGVEILKNDFNTIGEVVLDPTLLISPDRYNKIIGSYSDNNQDFITTMIFPGESSDSPNIHQSIDNFARINNLKRINIFGNKTYLSFSEWLYYISKSKFNIIDSYHGLLFSIIYKKDFICLGNKLGGNDRFQTILKICDLEDRFFSVDELNEDVLIKAFNKKIDWNKVALKLEKYSVLSRDFIRNALMENVEYNSKVLYNSNVKFKIIEVYSKISRKFHILLKFVYRFLRK